ncbi:MAG: HDOD domain-containing protein [Planctomycetes bacterium]|nr:HDOD domain-containing protein [Planctomycetota bacterium]
MRRILLVDNNACASRELKRMLGLMCPDWEIESAISGEEALKLMSGSHFDVLVSDICLDGIDGVELFDSVSKLYPEIVRIIHAKLSPPETILKSAMTVHQFLAKPCSAETMMITIERTCKLRDLLKNETLRKIVAGTRNLPSLPALYNSIISEMQSQEPSLRKVGHLISQDISMSAKILQLVNSAFFALPRKITDPQQASVYVGVESLKSLVLSIHAFSSFTDDAGLCGFSLTKMWKHCLMTGRLARDIARAEKASSKVVEVAMIAGMLHDIGKLIMLKVPRQFNKVMELINTTGCDSAEAEYKIMKTSHSELGAYLLGLWGLPGTVAETVAFHHNPSRLADRTFIIADKNIEGDSAKTESKESKFIPQSTAKYASEFTALTSVHIANALTIQENCSSETAILPYVDMDYLKTLELADRLPYWIELYNDTKQRSEINVQFD